jgi:predicted phosphodiesterase
VKRLFFIPDCHVPYEDLKAFALMLDVLKAFKADVVIILGDFCDFYSVSSHDKDASRKIDFMYEAEAAKDRLYEVNKAAGKKARKIFIEGNHEYRLDRYISTVAKELYGFVSTKELLDLKKLGFQHVPYKSFFKIGHLAVTHDTGRSGKACAQQTLADAQHNIVIGHAHRISYCVEGDVLGNPHVGACFGWLGDKDACDYMHKLRANRDWALGFGIGYLENNGNVHLRPIPIVDYRCVVEGRLFSRK